MTKQSKEINMNIIITPRKKKMYTVVIPTPGFIFMIMIITILVLLLGYGVLYVFDLTYLIFR